MNVRSIATAATCLWLASVALPAASFAESLQPGVLPQVAGVYRFKIGAVRVTALTDGTAPQDLHKLLQGIAPEKIDVDLQSAFLTNPVQTSINVYLLEIGGRRVLVDTGVGQLFGPGSGGRLIGSLAAAGVRPDQIDDILITHIHADHVGGLVLGGKVVFPKAIIHVGAPDMAYFYASPKSGPHGDPKSSKDALDMLKPYVASGRVKSFGSEVEILPGVTGSIHPGHTPGSAFYRLSSNGDSILFTGDIVHAAAVQLPSPEVTITYDADPALAAGVRNKVFADAAANRTLIAAPHLAFPGVGHIATAASGYRWEPVDYANWSKR